MTTTQNLDIASTFSNEDYNSLFSWVESRVKCRFSDQHIIEDFKATQSDCTEEDLRFVEWALYYFRLNGLRDSLENTDLSQNEELESKMKFAEEKDFDTLLNEFIETLGLEDDNSSEDIYKEGEEEEEEDEFLRQEDDDDYSNIFQEDFACTNIRLAIDSNPICKRENFNIGYGLHPMFKNDRFIHLKLCYIVSEQNEYGIEVLVQNYRCHTILREVVSAQQLKDGEGCITVTFDAEDLIPKRVIARDKIHISILKLGTHEEICDTERELLCANSIFDTLSVERMAFYRAFRESNPLNCNTATGYIGFKNENMLQINAHCHLVSTIGLDIEKYDLCYLLYDQTGNLIVKQDAYAYKDSNANICIAYYGFTSDDDSEWSEGRYKVELTALGKSIMVASFSIGSHALEGETDVAQVVSMLKANALIDYASDKAMDKLEQMVGLKRVKEKIRSLSRLSMLSQRRKEMGLPVKNASLHARFVGNPGTGKTTIAEIMGQIYKDLGLLSRGHVVRVERRNLVGRYYDSELRATEQAIESAQGGVLFIDEAYSLYVPDDPRDPGKHVLEALLTALSDEKRRDWMLVLAGYPDEIEQMMNANPGIKSRVNETLFFDDYDVEELMQIADLYCKRNKFRMSAEVRKHLHSVVSRDYGARDKHFGNARYINNLMEQTIAANMAHRVSRIENPTKLQLQTIEIEDIPSLREEAPKSKGMAGLNQMVGLSNLKRNLSQHLNMVKLANMRMKRGLHTQMPPLHMIFTGNPGTGKTTVADFLGEIYASMGLLSKGDVIRVEKRDLVGSHVGETERKMKSILNRAKGNILFIDEAYQLCAKEGQNDYGENVIDSLLTTLSNDQVDMIVILAGYPKDMERLLNMNDGLRSRFPYTFHFEDYSVDELHKIALQRAKSDNYCFTKRAEQLLKSLIKREVLRKRSSFGNARFVTRLLSAEILPRMATRLSNEVAEPTKRQLKTIIAKDIPISQAEAARIECGGFDDEAIDVALKRLDALVGQNSVKRAIHNFVDIARYLNSEGEAFVGKGLLKWNFVGNTGTGKSIVAEILAQILKAMNLLDKGNIVEVRGEQIFNVSEYQCDQVLRQAMELSRHGLLFIDGDAPEFRNMHEYRLTSEQLRIKLTSLVAEIGGQGALVIAECNSPRQTVANSLAINGIYDFDHTFFFDDYTSDELFEILCQRLRKHKVKFTAEAEAKIRKYIELLCENRTLSFANARTMKHLARTIYEQVILRTSRDKSSPRNRVLLGDVEGYNWQQSRKIGY